MPKAKLTDEQKEEMFNNWQNGPEYASIKKFIEKRPTVKPVEYGTVDVCEEMQPFLDALFNMVNDLKVPGKKAKGKLQFKYQHHQLYLL